MIPVKRGLYKVVDINFLPNETSSIKKYKQLLAKELAFCISKKQFIIKKANEVYNYQIKTNRVLPNYCDFKKLENVCDKYKTIIKELSN